MYNTILISQLHQKKKKSKETKKKEKLKKSMPHINAKRIKRK